MKRTKNMLLSALIFCSLPYTQCLAQIPELVKDELKTRVEQGIYPSIALGIWNKGETHYYIYGKASRNPAQEADKNTLYEIGDATQIYTALLLARYVYGDSTRLGERIPPALRDSSGQFPDTGITWKELATHTSGLPSLPEKPGYPAKADPYAGYSRKELFTYTNLHSDPGQKKKYRYSITGFGLLGELLSDIQKTDYNSLLKKDITEPLRLQHTFLEVPPGMRRHYATGYTDTIAEHWHFKALAAARGIKSNITDLLSFAASFIESDTSLKGPASLTLKAHFNDRKGHKQGLGWHFRGNVAFINGNTGGFHSFVALNPDRRTAVAVLANSGVNPVDDVALYLADSLRNNILKTPEPVAIPSGMLKQYAGSYQNNGLGASLEITYRDNKLYVSAPDIKPKVIYHYGHHRFFFKDLLARITFETDGNDIPVGLLLRQNGREILLIKDDNPGTD
ncbi:serine hydrolase [Sinomicrobium soli]|uniref:serine hydrolase n=1 Tax=Sinomicrobium sp. N-1-3-6 TaxID=2219864 RepID=UPI000DCB100F|nr:serine hydrolase [Sinomicrobium sp. N-1-3-6]RAV27502.1 hypothetical protein DN748_18245 [Sinomicrobium sp. N-1-3-6]